MSAAAIALELRPAHLERCAPSFGLAGALEVAAAEAAREAARASGVERRRLYTLAERLRGEARGLRSMQQGGRYGQG